MVLERKRFGNFEKKRNSDRLSDAWCETIRSKKQRGVDGLAGYKKSLDRMPKETKPNIRAQDI